MSSILKVEEVSSKKGDFNLKNIGFELDESEILLIAGRNGAGKTTLLETIVGINKPIDGKLELLSNLIYRGRLNKKNLRKSLRKIGILLQNEDIFSELTVRETFETFSSLYPDNIYDEIIENCQYINKELDKNINSLSEGKKQLTKIILSLGNKPSLVIMDEPSANLDEEVKSWLFKIVKQLKNDGTSFIITSNETWEIGKITDKLIILEDGRLKESIRNFKNFYNGSLTELREELDDDMIKSDHVLKQKKLDDKTILFSEKKKSDMVLLLENKDIVNYDVREVRLKDFYPRSENR